MTLGRPFNGTENSSYLQLNSSNKYKIDLNKERHPSASRRREPVKWAQAGG